MLPYVHNADELTALIEMVGLLPMFRSVVPGFSLEEVVPAELWFQEGVEGPWEWREIIAGQGKIAYGKFFRQKAGFVSMRWFSHLIHARRSGMDYHQRYSMGQMKRETYQLIEALDHHLPLLAPELREAAGLPSRQIFQRALTDAMMQTDVVIASLEYKKDAAGRPYGWGTGRYDLSDRMFGPWIATPDCSPEASMNLLCQQISDVAQCEPEAARRLLNYR